MRAFSASPLELLSSFLRNKDLIFSLSKREIIGRYRGSALGIFWSLFTPLFMLSVYTFVFSVVFKARWGEAGGSQAEFALILFADLLIFNFFSECVARAPSLVVSNVNYVKKVIFPLEILPFVSVLSALYHLAVSFLVWLAAYILFMGMPHLTVFLFPIVLLPLVLLVLGVSWFLSSLTVYLRDISQVIGVVITVLMFLSPIFYPVTALPEKYRDVLYANPLTSIIEMARDVLFWGKLPSLPMVFLSLLLTSVLAYIGFAWFQKVRKGFADVL